MTEDATFWRMEAERHAPAPLGTIGQNTISRAELGAYGRRHGWGRDTAGAVVDDIVAHREPAAENATPAATPPPVAADLTPAQCEALRRMTEEWGDALDAVRSAVDLLGARIHSAEDARIIAAARDALRVLEGAEADPEPVAAIVGPAEGSLAGRRVAVMLLHDPDSGEVVDIAVYEDGIKAESEAQHTADDSGYRVQVWTHRPYVRGGLGSGEGSGHG